MRERERATHKLEELVDVEVSLRVDGGVKQRQEHVAEQLLEARHHLVLTIHVASTSPRARFTK